MISLLFFCFSANFTMNLVNEAGIKKLLSNIFSRGLKELMRVKVENRDTVSQVNINNKKRKKKISSSSTEGKSFETHLKDINQEEIKKRFDKLLNLVDEQGEKLKKSLDKKDLKEYKKRVKDILRLVQNEFAQTKQSFSWDGAGNLKTYTIIEEVDQNLSLLHNLFLQEQADVLEVVKKLDEIRGLLLDLYI